MKKKKQAFTLAEVLITLTVIGVVASLTVPALMNNVRSSRNRTTLKKELSLLNQAVRMNYANFEWDFSSVSDIFSKYDKQRARHNYNVAALLNDSLTGERILGNIEVDKAPDLDKYGFISDNNINLQSAGWYIAYHLADNSVLGISRFTTAVCTENEMDKASLIPYLHSHGCVGFIDVNGPTPPNKEITCANGTAHLRGGKKGDDANKQTYETCDVNDNVDADIFPFVFYDQTVELSTDAGYSFLIQK